MIQQAFLNILASLRQLPWLAQILLAAGAVTLIAVLLLGWDIPTREDTASLQYQKQERLRHWGTVTNVRP